LGTRLGPAADLDRRLTERRTLLAIAGRRKGRRRHLLLALQQPADLQHREDHHRQQHQLGQVQESGLDGAAEIERHRTAVRAHSGTSEKARDEGDQPEQRGKCVLTERDEADHLRQPQLRPDVRGDQQRGQRDRDRADTDEHPEAGGRAKREAAAAAGGNDQLLDGDQQVHRVETEQREADRQAERSQDVGTTTGVTISAHGFPPQTLPGLPAASLSHRAKPNIL
jgi:hypothetical protein